MTIGTGTATGTQRTALVVGATGIAGSALVDRLAGEGWAVLALSRRPGAERPGVRWLSADLTSAASLTSVLGPENPSHVFFTAWSRRDTEEENITVNAGMVRDLLAALRGKDVAHVALMTGLKHYLGPFEAYAAGKMADTPFPRGSRACRCRTSITPRRMSSGPRPRSKGSRGLCIARTR